MKKKDIQIFNNEEFGEVRIIGTPDNPLFCLADVCRALGLQSKHVIERLDKGVVSSGTLSTNGGNQTFNFINEDGLYDVIFDSRKPEAKKFRKWVTSEVLPSIRKTGTYTTDPVLLQTIDRLRTKELAMEQLLEGVPLYTTDELKLEVGQDTGNAIIDMLSDYGVLEKMDYGWEVTKEYADKGLVTFRTHMERKRGKDRLTRQVLLTDRGRLVARYLFEQYYAITMSMWEMCKAFKYGIFPTLNTPLTNRAVEREKQKTIVINNN